ncbi:MAG: EpsG family protein [Bacteroidales bacterium]|nr:EpsG family protein [Bacteroidales bacterium]
MPIYYVAVAILSFMAVSQYETFPNERMYEEQNQSGWGIALFAILLSLFIGFRPVSVDYFVDMENYADSYNALRTADYVFYTAEDSNILFDNIYLYMATHGVSATYFFLLIAVLYFVCIAWACSMIFPKDKFISILVYLSAFSTYSYGVNGIKAGVAAALFLVAVAFFQKRQWVGVIVFTLLSYGMHHAMVLPIAAFWVCIFVKDPKLFLGFWVVCFVLSLFKVTIFQELMADLVNEHGAEYLRGAGGYVKDIFGGFRIDFVLYSIVPMVVGLIAIEKKQIHSEKFEFLLNLYTMTNAVWLLCMYSDYTNRIAYLSWFLYPIVLIYPFLNEEWEGPKYKLFQWVVYGHLVFNLIMVFIYW